MAKKDDKEFEYIAALQDYNKSLKYFIDSIKNQVAKGNDIKGSVGASAEQAKAMAEMAEELKVISATTESTKSNTEQILDIVKGIKKEKKSSLVDKLVGAKDKTKSIAEGIKSIALMAGSILAIGLAFKIVGDVDFKSVLALAIALPLIAEAFNIVGETAHDPKEAALISFAMIIMATGIAISGTILSTIPEIGFKQLLSAVGVSIAMSAAMFGLAFAADKMGVAGVTELALIAVVLPAIAWGITKSAEVLQGMPEIGFKEILSAGAVGVAMGIATIPLAFAAKMIGDGIDELLVLSLAMPLLAAGIYASALILQNMPEVDFIKTITSTLGTTVAIVLFGAGIWVLDKLGMNIETAIVGSLSMIAIAGGILATSHILSAGDYSNGPSLEWAEGMALSMGAFGLGAVALGIVMLTGIGALALIAGVGAMIGVAAGLVAVSEIIAGGSFTGGPSKEWAEGVGMSLMYFANALDKIKPNIFERLLGDTMDQNMASLVSLGGALYNIGKAVGSDNSVYTGGPKKEWAEGVGLSLASFTDALSKIEPGFFAKLGGATLQGNINGLILIAGSLQKIGAAVGTDTSMYTGGPKKEWAEGVGMSLVHFADALDKLKPGVFSSSTLQDNIMGMIQMAGALPLIGIALKGADFSTYPSKDWVDGVGGFLNKFSKLSFNDDAEETAKNIGKLSMSYVYLAKALMILGKGMQSITNVPDLSGIYGGIVTLSLIDSDRLDATLEILDDKKDQFKNVLSMIQAQSSVSIDSETFAFNKDKSTEKQNNTSNNNTKTQTATPIQAKSNNIDRVKEEAKKNENEKIAALRWEKLLLYTKETNKTLVEIADNTTVKMDGTISHK